MNISFSLVMVAWNKSLISPFAMLFTNDIKISQSFFFSVFFSFHDKNQKSWTLSDSIMSWNQKFLETLVNNTHFLEYFITNFHIIYQISRYYVYNN